MNVGFAVRKIVELGSVQLFVGEVEVKDTFALQVAAAVAAFSKLPAEERAAIIAQAEANTARYVEAAILRTEARREARTGGTAVSVAQPAYSRSS